MTKSDSPKYEAPRGVRLGDATNGRGHPSCADGNSDISCGDGLGANATCVTGNNAIGCLVGTDATQQTGCQNGDTVTTL